MNGIENPVVFYPAAFVLILFAVMTICFKNIFYSLLSSIVVFFTTGVIFYILGSEYNAVIQAAVYGIAVPVIIGLGIMFTDMKKLIKDNSSALYKALIILAGGVFLLAVIYITLTSIAISPWAFNIREDIYASSYEVIQAFGKGIFVKYVWAFEIVSLILTIIAAGLTIFARGGKNE